MKLFLKLTFAIIFFSITAVTSSSAAAYDSYIIKFKDIPTAQTIQSLTDDYQISVSYPIKNIVNYTDNKSNRTLSSAQINLLRSLSGYRVIKFNNKNKSEQFATEMSSDRRIESIEPNYIFNIDEGEETGPDPLQKNQWSLKAVKAERAWKKASGKGIVVGVIDTGIDPEHPDLVNSLWINSKEDINGNGVADLSKLEELSIRNNQFTNLPVCVGELTSLKLLWIQDNQFTTIPDFIGNLSNLEWLHIGLNQLTTLPESLKNLTKLRDLILKGNNFSESERTKIQTWLPNCKIKWD